MAAGRRTPFVGVDRPFAKRDVPALSIPLIQPTVSESGCVLSGLPHPRCLEAPAGCFPFLPRYLHSIDRWTMIARLKIDPPY
jgi:hypothetical protein